MVKHHPGMKFCIPFIIGIIIGWKWTFSPSLAVVLALCGIIIVVLSVRSAGRWSVTSAPSLTFIALILLGIFKITFDANFIPSNRIVSFISPGRSIHLEGRISDLPTLGNQSVRFGIEAQSITVGASSYEVSGGVLVYVRRIPRAYRLMDSLTYGRQVTMTGELVMPGGARNPGEFDARRYLELDEIYARFNVDEKDSIIPGQRPENNFYASWVYPVRLSVSQRLDSLIGGAEGNFLKGLVIGERSEIASDVKTAFINSGVMHIIAVSGLHVAIVVLILLFLLQLLRIPDQPRIIITCLLLVYYIVLTGSAASVARSVLMAIMFLLAKLIERKTDVYNTLSLSALILLFIDSKQLFQAGFQLSFVAVFSLVYLYPKVYALKDHLPEKLRASRIVTGTFASLSVSLAAGIGTLPFTSIYFGKISLASFVANMIIVPLSNAILALGMLTVGASYASAVVASLYAEVTTFLTWLLLKLVKFFGDLPFAYVESHFSAATAVAFYGIVAAIVNSGTKEVRKHFLFGGLIVSNLWLYGSFLLCSSAQLLRATFLDVGQGDALFLEFPDGKTMVIDGGPLTHNVDAGERFIVPFLSRQGIHRINVVVVTHPHSDHIGGISYLLKHVAVDEVIDAGSCAHSGLCSTYLHVVDSIGITHGIARGGMTLHDVNNVRIFMLHPTEQFLPPDSSQRVSLNNQSVVVKIVYGMTSLMLVGDTEREAEDNLVSVYGNFLQSDVLKVGHHGSITSSSPHFLNCVRPHLAVISVGVRNKFRHPSPVVLKRLIDRKCEYFRTDQSGAIIMESDGKVWSLVEWR